MSAAPRSRNMLILLAIAALLAAGLVLATGIDMSATTNETRRLFGIWRLRQVLVAMALALVGTGLFLAAVSRQALFNFILSTMSVVLCFAMLEGAGQTGLVSWSSLFGVSKSKFGDLGTKAVPGIDIKGSTQQDIASMLGLPHDPIPFHYKTDRHGFRNMADRASADIILVGDSILVGALVPIEQIAATRLETAVRRPVLQIALIGLSPQAQQQLLWKAGLELKGRIVIQFIFEGNDLLDSRAWRQGGAGQSAATQRSYLINEIWALLTSRTDPSLRSHTHYLCQIGNQQHAFLWTERSHAGHADEAGHITAALEDFGAELARRGARLAVVFVPTKYRVLADECSFAPTSNLSNRQANLTPLRDHMRAWRTSSGIAMLDLTDALKSAAQSGRSPWFWGDTHWNASGHAIAAAEIARWIVLDAKTGAATQDNSRP
jgi:hypothetical protein